MKVTPETREIQEIFKINDNLCYYIPNFQRRYVWQKEQIEELVTDITNNSQKDSGWYLGSILISEIDSKKMIIDGQQRLTTISLFLLSIRQKMISLQGDEQITEDNKRRIERQVYDIERMLFTGGKVSIDNYKIQHCSLDKKQIEKIIDNNYSDIKTGKVIAAMKIIDNEISGLSQKTNPNDILSEIETLYLEKLSKAEILKISAENIQDAYQIFLTLNNRGQQLSPLDILKVICLGLDGGNNSNQKLWNDFVNIFEDDNKQSDRIQTFLLCYHDAIIENSKAITKKDLINEYENLFKEKSSNQELELFFAELSKYAKIFLEISGIKYQSEFEEEFRRLSSLQAAQCYPLVLFLMDKLDNSNKDEIKKIIDFLIKFFVRRNIVLTPKASNIRGQAMRCIKELKTKGIKLESVKNKFNELNGYPDDKKLELALDDNIFSKKNVCRYLLIDIERSNKPLDKGTLDPYNDPKQWNIEHIYPQSAVGEVNGEIDNWKHLEDENVGNCLGNLTLTAYNSELGTKSFQEKLEYKDERTNNYTGLKRELYLNELFRSEDCPKEWNEDEIKKRNEWFKKLILEMYKI